MTARTRANKSYHHGDLRDSLLEAAVDLIATRGVAGLSLRECARSAGVSHAAPYRHFRDKSELLIAIAEDGFRKLAAAGLRAMQRETDPRARVDAYGVAYVRFAAEHPVHHRVMFTLAPKPESDPTGPGAQAFTLLVESATAAAPPGTDPMLAALASWSLAHGLSMLILDQRVPSDLVRTPDHVEGLARAVIQQWRRTSA